MRPLETRKRSNRLIAIIIFLALAAVAAAAFLVPRMFNPAGDASVKVDLPVIRTVLTSRDDGQEHTVQTVFTVEMDRQTSYQINNDTLEEALTEIMQGMDFEALQKPDAIAYLGAQATEQLNAYLADQTESKVYVTGFMIGEQVQLQDPPEHTGEVMEGLFQNVN